MNILQRSVTDLKGVGEQLATRLAKLQIKTIQDVLFHLPSKYVDRTRIHPIGTCLIDDNVVIEGMVQKSSVIPKPRRSLVVNIADSSGKMTLRFFHFNLQQQGQFKFGTRVRCFGLVKAFKNTLHMVHPEYRIIQDDKVVPVEEHLTPIYSVCEGISQNLIRNLVKQSLHILEPIQDSLEILPNSIRDSLQYQSWYMTLKNLHSPPPDLDVTKLQKRMAFEELLAQHLTLRQKRRSMEQQTAYPIEPVNKSWQKLKTNLPFNLTSAQERAIAQINEDLRKSTPMVRLAQGDVGSGKTMVAVAGALQVLDAGLQVALMAPTEILAEQHWRNISNWCQPLGIEVALLTGKTSAADKKQIYAAMSDGKLKFVVGTHALVQESVRFEKLALVIIDEQHRFGVGQRLALRKKGRQPHQLILTATPIPRTLAMTFHADMDYTVIDELPPGRKPITTILLCSTRRDEILDRIKNIVSTGQQVYWVCTLIEDSESLDCTPAEIAWQELSEKLPGLQVGLIHGRMKSQEKENIMQRFSANEINVLVATTVIEVGVDVPNASLMVIENPERLGLAQLHQLRGRVGRGNSQSYCVLMYKKPISSRVAERLQFLRDSQDGFAIAEFDLQLRGPGEVFGTRQSGIAAMRIADLVRDKDLLPKVTAAADVIISDYKEFIPGLIQRWIREQVQYAAV